MRPRRPPTLRRLLLLLLAPSAVVVPATAQDLGPVRSRDEVVVRNSKVEFVFSGQHGLALARIGRPGAGAPEPDTAARPGVPRQFQIEPRALWLTEFRDPATGAKTEWSPENTTYSFQHALNQVGGTSTLTMQWTGLVIDANNDFDVELIFDLPVGSEVASLQATVTTRTPDQALFRLDLPRISVRRAPDGQGPTWLVTPWAGGTVLREPHDTLQLLPNGWTTGVPSLNAAEFWAFQYGSSPAVLLYLSPQDAGYYAKNAHLESSNSRHAMVSIENFPENHRTAGPRTYVLPNQPVVGCLDGRRGWYGAADYYRRWARKNGLLGTPVRNRTDMDVAKNADFFAAVSVDPTSTDGVGDYTRVLSAMADWMAFLNDCSTLPDCVPGAVTFDQALVLVTDWYGCQPGKRTGWFQWSPPPDPRVQDMLDQAPPGVHLIPYYQPNRLHDSDVANSGLLTWAHTEEAGNLVRTIDNDGDPLTLNTELDTSSSGMINFLTGEVVNGLQPMGWKGVFFDTWAQKDSRLEYSGNDGHPVGGGNFMATGIRATAQSVRGGARMADPDFLFAVEHVSQDLLGHTDFALENRPAPLYYTYGMPGMDLYIAPVFSAVFQEYAPRGITSSTSPTITISEDIFKYLWAINFQYGLLPCISNFDVDDDPTHPITDSRVLELYRFLQRLYRFQHFKGEFFLRGRRLQDLPLTGISLVPQGSLWSSEPRYFFPAYGDSDYPSVFSSAWRSPAGHVAVALINWTTQDETFALRFDAVADVGMAAQGTYQLFEEKETGRVLLGSFSTPKIELAGTVGDESIRVFTVE